MLKAFALLLLPSALLAVSAGQPAPAFKVLGLDGIPWTQQGPAWVPGRDGAVPPPGLVQDCVLVDFWASWCVPCLQEIPALNALQAKYGRSGRLLVLGLSLDKGGAPVVRAQAAKHLIAYTVAPVDPKVADAYGIVGFPSAFLLRDGKVLKVLTGRRNLGDFERDLNPYLSVP